MRLGDKSLSFVVNFLLGVAWATAFIGAVSTFLFSYSDSFVYALLSAVMASLPGLIGVLCIEYFILSKEKHEELQKHSKLLKEILDKGHKS